MADQTEAMRRALVPEMPAELRKRVHDGEQIWTSSQMQAEFDVIGFAAPLMVVRRKSDQAMGSLMFTHSPRFYFGWVAD
jgi:hypothetical protein